MQALLQNFAILRIIIMATATAAAAAVPINTIIINQLTPKHIIIYQHKNYFCNFHCSLFIVHYIYPKMKRTRSSNKRRLLLSRYLMATAILSHLFMFIKILTHVAKDDGPVHVRARVHDYGYDYDYHKRETMVLDNTNNNKEEKEKEREKEILNMKSVVSDADANLVAEVDVDLVADAEVDLVAEVDVDADADADADAVITTNTRNHNQPEPQPNALETTAETKVESSEKEEEEAIMMDWFLPNYQKNDHNKRTVPQEPTNTNNNKLLMEPDNDNLNNNDDGKLQRRNNKQFAKGKHFDVYDAPPPRQPDQERTIMRITRPEDVKGLVQQHYANQDREDKEDDDYQNEDLSPTLAPTPQPEPNTTTAIYRDKLLQRDLYDGSPIVIESHKLLFLTTPKVSCTVFKQLLRRMMGYPDWKAQNGTLPHNRIINGLDYLGDIKYRRNLTRVNEMLNSKEWTFAVFVRDPKERLLSAYLDKAYWSWYIQNLCCKHFQLPSTTPGCSNSNYTTNNYTAISKSKGPIMPFDVWVKELIPVCPDHHWTPQYNQLPSRLWPTIDFIGSFDNLYNDTKTLLQQLTFTANNANTTSTINRNAWDEFGKTGWGESGKYSIFDPQLKSGVTHKTGAKTKLQSWYTPEIEALVEQYYKDDYSFERFQFQKDIQFQLNSTTLLSSVSRKPQPEPNTSTAILRDRFLRRDLYDGSPIVIESHKLLFLTTPKVSCTVFKQLLRRMMGKNDWKAHHSSLPHNRSSNGLDYLGDIKYRRNLTRVNEMLNSKEWTFAVFVRDPKERLLSAYLDKAPWSWYIQDRCCNKFQLPSTTPGCQHSNYTTNNYTAISKGKGPIMPFDVWVKELIPICPDHHWTPQYNQLPSRLWPTVDFIGSFDNLYNDTKRLLQQLTFTTNHTNTTSTINKNAWDEFGKTGWGESGKYSIFDPQLKSSVIHRTGAKTKLQSWYTPEIEALVEQYYKDDYSFERFPFHKRQDDSIAGSTVEQK